jgi:hypothetical protein
VAVEKTENQGDKVGSKVEKEDKFQLEMVESWHNIIQ